MGGRDSRPDAVGFGFGVGGRDSRPDAVGFGFGAALLGALAFPQVWARFGGLPASILLHAGHGFGSGFLNPRLSFSPSHPPSRYSSQSRDISVCMRPLMGGAR